MINIIPSKWIGDLIHEEIFYEEINVGDTVRIIIDSQFNDSTERRYKQTGKVVTLDGGDEWGYEVEFSDSKTNWFKRYHLQKV